MRIYVYGCMYVRGKFRQTQQRHREHHHGVLCSLAVGITHVCHHLKPTVVNPEQTKLKTETETHTHTQTQTQLRLRLFSPTFRLDMKQFLFLFLRKCIALSFAHSSPVSLSFAASWRCWFHFCHFLARTFLAYIGFHL